MKVKMLVYLLVVFFSISSFARGPRGRGGMGYGTKGGPGNGGFAYQRKQRMIEELKLNKDQIVKMEELRKTFQTSMQKKRDKLKVAQDELSKALDQNKKDKAYKKVLREKHNAVVNIHSEMAKDRFEEMLSIRDLLDDNQFTLYQNVRNRHGGKGRKGGMGYGRGPKGRGRGLQGNGGYGMSDFGTE